MGHVSRAERRSARRRGDLGRLFVHCHYFWGNVCDQHWLAVLGKIVAACGLIAGLGFLLVRNGVLGRA